MQKPRVRVYTDYKSPYAFVANKRLFELEQQYGIELEWLIELFPTEVEERSTVEWNRTAERVDAVNAIVFDGLTIDETRGAMPDRAKAAGDPATAEDRSRSPHAPAGSWSPH